MFNFIENLFDSNFSDFNYFMKTFKPNKRSILVKLQTWNQKMEINI